MRKVTEQGEGKSGAGNLDQNTTHDGVGLERTQRASTPAHGTSV